MQIISRVYFIVMLALVLAAPAFAAHAADIPSEVLTYADVVFYNGSIITVDEKFSVPQALAVRDGKVLKVGTNDAILRLAGSKTRRIDLKGRSVIPGLIDSHSHAQATASDRYGKELAEVPGKFARYRVSEAKNWASGKEDIRALVRKAKKGEWVIGSILRGTFINMVTKKQLDEVAPYNPLVIYERPSVGVANSMAIQEIINLYGPDVEGMLKDDKGEPTGHVRKPLVGLLAYEVFPGLPVKVLAGIYKKRLEDYPAVGITTISTSMEANAISAFNYLNDHDGMLIRLGFGMRNIARDNPQAAMYMKRLGILTGIGSDRLWMVGQDAGSADGGLGGSYSAMCTTIPKLIKLPTDYTGSEFGDCRMQKGNSRWKGHMAVGMSGGRIVNTHVAGDKAHDTFLDLLEEIENNLGEGTIREMRMAVDHGVFIRPDQIERAKKLGVCWTEHTGYVYRDAHWLVKMYGRDMVEKWMTPLRSLLDAGMHVAWHTSTEFVTDLFPPFMHLQFMVTRKDRFGDVYGAAQKITRQEALRMMTMGSAYYVMKEKVIGSLEPGKYADLVVIDKDFMKVPDDELSKMQVLMTFVEGKPVYAVPKFSQEVSWPGISSHKAPITDADRKRMDAEGKGEKE